MTWIFRQTLFCQSVEIENSTNCNKISFPIYGSVVVLVLALTYSLTVILKTMEPVS